MQLLVIIPPSKWQICVSCMKGTCTRPRFILNRFSPAHYTHCIFVRVVNDEAFFLSSATFFLFSPSLKRRWRRSNNSRKLNFHRAMCSRRRVVFVPYYIFAMLHTLPCILCYPRELFTFFLFLLFLLHPHPPTIRLQNSCTAHNNVASIGACIHTLLPLARDFLHHVLIVSCAFFLPEAFSWKKNQAFSRMCSKWGKWGLSFLTNIN